MSDDKPVTLERQLKHLLAEWRETMDNCHRISTRLAANGYVDSAVDFVIRRQTWQLACDDLNSILEPFD
jgi:dienelactone hydrolase